MAALKILPVFAVILFGLAVYFFATGNLALGAAMIAIGSSQLAIFAAVTAKNKADREGAR